MLVLLTDCIDFKNYSNRTYTSIALHAMTLIEQSTY